MPTNTSRPRFNKDGSDRIILELRSALQQREHRWGRWATPINLLRIALLLAAWGLLHLGLLSPRPVGQMLTCYAALGLVLFLLYFHIFHDAAHHNLLPWRRANDLILRLLDVIGTSSHLYKQKHTRLHHPYPNIPGWDADIEQTDIVCVSPRVSPKWFHHYQHLYMPALYLLYTLNWFFVRDFKDVFDKERVVRQHMEIPVRERIITVFGKPLHLTLFLFLPMLLQPAHWGLVLGGWLLMHATMSGLGMVVLLSTHVTEETQWMRFDAEGRSPHSWVYYQMISTNDFATRSWVTNLLFGSINHHVVHHLLPGASSLHTPFLTKHVRVLAQEMELPYRSYSIPQAFAAHFRFLRHRDFRFSVFDEDM